MANLFLGNTFQSPPKADGTVNAGGLVHFYEPGTSTRKDTYSDNALTTPNANPLVLDSAGRGVAFLKGKYKVRLETSDGVLIKELDNVNDMNLLTDADRYNKVVNGDFEQATVSSTLPDEWTITLYTSGTAALDSTDRHSGLKSLKFTSTGTGGGYAVTNNYISVSPDIPLNVNVSLKSSDAGVRNLVEVLWYTSAQVLDSTTTLYDDSTTNPTSWTAKSFAANPPSTAYYAKLRITGCHSSDATTGSTWFDTVSATQVLQTLSYGSKAADIASAATVDLSAATGNSVTITGTTGITAFGTVPAGTSFVLTFAASLTITHNATSLICPNNQNIVTQAGDEVVVRSLGAGNWRVLIYKPQLISAFEATLATNRAVAATTWTTIIYDTEVYDNLGEYDPATGIVTVKAPGIYQFEASMIFNAVDGQTAIMRFADSADVQLKAPYYNRYGAAGDVVASGMATIKLAAGATVKAQFYSSVAETVVNTATASYFSGRRLA